MANEHKNGKKFSTAVLAGATALALLIGIGGTYAATSLSSGGAVVEYKGGEVSKQDVQELAYDRVASQIAFQETMNALLEEEYGKELDQKKVDEEFKKTEEQFGSKEEFENAIKQAGMTGIDEFKEALRSQLLVDIAKEKQVKVSEEDIKAQFEKENVEVRASHILVETEEQAKDIQKQLKDGADFAKLAKEKSTDTGSGAKGGDLGYFTVGTMVPEFEAYAFKDDVVGKVSEPIQSQFGFHIIKVVDRKEKDLKFEDEKARIKEQLSAEKAAAIDANAIYAELIEKYDVDVKDKAAKAQFDAVIEAAKAPKESEEAQ